MAVCRMKKVQIVAHKSLRAEIISYLQDKGAIHITNLQTENEESEEAKSDVAVLEKRRELSESLSRIRFALGYLDQFADKKQKGIIPSTGGKLVFSPEQYSEVTSEEGVAKALEVADKSYQLSSEISRLESQIARIRSEQTGLAVWRDLTDPIETLTDSNKVVVRIGSIPALAYHDMMEELNQTTEYQNVDLINQSGSEASLVIIFLKEEEPQLNPILAKYGFSQAVFPRNKGRISDILSELQQEEKRIEDRIRQIEQEAKELVRYIPNLMAVYDHLSEELQRLEVQDGFIQTNATFMLEGWIKEEDLEGFKRDLTARFAEVEIFDFEVGPDEEPPVAIKNNRLIEPFQMVTSLYGMPQYREIDPTPFFAPFFAFFFGICITDAGYGLVLILLSILALKFYGMGKGARQLMKIILMSGVMTVVAGILTGGFFGLKTPEPLHRFIVVDPGDPAGQTRFLYISWGIGTVHVWIGFLLKVFVGLRARNFREAFRSDLPWVLMIPLIVLLFPSSTRAAAGVLLAICAVWVVALSDIESQSIGGRIGNGLFNLYGVSGVIGDVLSYSRLFALGLATGIIAQVVNEIAKMVSGVPVAGPVIMVLVLIGGHIFNIVINALGGFIHTARLQFVEYFTKFFEGGGNEFRPFAKKSEYTVVMNLESLRQL